MKTTFPEKSKDHEEKIRQISDIIVSCGKDKIAFVILFGSFARGSWVFDRYSEGMILYQYASDYDFLIITKTGKQATDLESGSASRLLNRELQGNNIFNKYGHNPHFVIESIDYINSELEKGKYFFSDIKKEGITLYNSDEFELAEPKELSDEEKRQIAGDDYRHWMENVSTRLEDFYSNFSKSAQGKQYLNKAAFELHQATEGLYNCTLLTLGGYKPKSHDLIELNKLCCVHSHDFLTTFPTATKEQQDCFNLLQKAYIDARYNKSYVITKEQLEYLIGRVEKLKGLVELVCGERIW
jgi:predicted nucleotidyltransferase/HEPN domain-containing protein